jgi:hypothetical protein
MLGRVSTSERQPNEEELRAAYEAELKRLRVEQVLLEGIVSLINLGMRRTGLAPGTEDEREPEQVRLAIEGVRMHLPLVESVAPQQAAQIREALSQMQLAYVRIGGAPPAAGGDSADPAAPGPAAPGPAAPGATAPGTGSAASTAPPEPAEEPITPGEAGPAQRSGRLWIPGQ